MEMLKNLIDGTIELEFIKKKVKHELDGHALDSLKFYMDRDEIRDVIVTGLCNELVAEPLDMNKKKIVFHFAKEVGFNVPTSWFQMLKKQHAPKWFLEKYPVKERVVKKVIRDEQEVVVEVSAVYPKLPIVFSGNEKLEYHVCINQKDPCFVDREKLKGKAEVRFFYYNYVVMSEDE